MAAFFGVVLLGGAFFAGVEDPAFPAGDLFAAGFFAGAFFGAVFFAAVRFVVGLFPSAFGAAAGAFRVGGSAVAGAAGGWAVETEGAAARDAEVRAAVRGSDVRARTGAAAGVGGAARAMSAARRAASAARVAAGSGSNVRREPSGPACAGPAAGMEARARARDEPGIGCRGSSRSWMTGATIRMTSSSLAEARGSSRTP